MTLWCEKYTHSGLSVYSLKKESRNFRLIFGPQTRMTHVNKKPLKICRYFTGNITRVILCCMLRDTQRLRKSILTFFCLSIALNCFTHIIISLNKLEIYSKILFYGFYYRTKTTFTFHLFSLVVFFFFKFHFVSSWSANTRVRFTLQYVCQRMYVHT